MFNWRKNLTLANRITITRILLIPVFILLTLYYVDSITRGVPNELLRWGATLVFVVTCLTDALDGYVARAHGEKTRLGTVLDPLADKLLLLSGLVLLSGPSGRYFQPHLPVWYVLLVISRDVILIAGAFLIHVDAGHAEVRPRLSGKLATVFQMALILWVLIGGAPTWFQRILWLAAACTLVSAIQYVRDGVLQMEKAHAHEKPTPAP